MKTRARMNLGWAITPLLILLALPAHAADDSASGLQAFLWPAVNLIILIAVLVYFTRKPLRAYFDKRRSDESTYADWQRRMIDLDGELEEIRTTARQRAEAERERIIEDARASAERIRRDATAAVDLELRRAREILREEAAQLAIELAGERLAREVTDVDRDRLVDEFIDLIGSTPDSDANQREGA
jgi:F-type H+-transporting ATPase subunit b